MNRLRNADFQYRFHNVHHVHNPSRLGTPCQRSPVLADLHRNTLLGQLDSMSHRFARFADRFVMLSKSLDLLCRMLCSHEER